MSRKKSLFINLIYSGVSNVLNVFFPLITVYYISRVLLSSGVGKVNYANNIVSWFLLFAALGIPRYGVREIARAKEKSAQDLAFSELFLINLISTLISSIIYIIVVFTVPSFRNNKLLFFVAGIQLLINSINIDWLFQGLEDFSFITIRNFIVKVTSITLMLIFVKTQDDYIRYALIQSIAVTLNHLLGIIHSHKYVQFTVKNICLSKHMKSIWVLLSTQLAVSVYALLDTTMLGIMCTDSVVGYYTNVHKLISLLAELAAALGVVVFPSFVSMVANKDNEGIKQLAEKTLDSIIILCAPITVGILLVANDVVVVIFGNDFLPAIKTLMIFSPFVLISTIGNLFGTQLLMAYQQEKKLLTSVVVGSIVNFILNIIMIKMWQQDGAALASVLAELIVMIVQIVMVGKWVKILPNRKSLLQVLIMSGCMILGVTLAKKIISDEYIRLICSIFTGVLLYGVMGLVLRNETMCTTIEKLKNLVMSKIK